MQFNKPPLSVTDQVQRMVSRGLNVTNPTLAEHHLKHIGYYRFSAYALPFQQLSAATVNGIDKPFRSGTRFDDILAVYNFDRNLRIHILDAIERVEVSFRTSLVYHISHAHGAHWHLDSSLFKTSFNHNRFVQDIRDKFRPKTDSDGNQYRYGETFVQHYFQKYTTPDLPPSWMMSEILTLGTWSLVFKNLRNRQLKRTIARDFGVHESILEKWIHTISSLRNLCAHHCRIWNRKFVMKPIIANNHSAILNSNDYLYAQLVVLFDLFNQINPGSNWALKLDELIKSCPNATLSSMGFPEDWQEEPFWNIT